MIATDPFRTNAFAMQFPANHYFTITPDDDNELEQVTRAISFAAAGTLHIIDAAGSDVMLSDGALAAGIMHPLRVRKVFATGTTATGIGGYV